MHQVFGENDYNLGFKLTERRCSRESAVVITDLSYADDIALISQELYQAQELLQRVELEARKIGLTLNTRKTEVIGYNLQQSLFYFGKWKKLSKLGRRESSTKVKSK